MARKAPEMIVVPAEALDGIKLRISSCELMEEDRRIVLAIIGTYAWLMQQLQFTRLTIHRLKKMFGFSTEKHSSVSKNKEPADFSSEGTSAKQALSPDNLQGINQETPEKK